MVSVGAGCSQLLSDMQAFKVKFCDEESLSYASTRCLYAVRMVSNF
jgi:hypothetical protein